MNMNQIGHNLLKDVPPHSLEAERTVLGGILVGNKDLGAVLSIVSPEDFYNEAHQIIFGKIITMLDKGDPVDVLTLNDAFERAKMLKVVGGVSYISSLMDGIPKSSNIKHYARIIKERSIYRQLIHLVAQTIASSCGQGEDLGIVIDKLQTGLSDLSSEAREIKAPAKPLDEYLKEKYEIESKRKVNQLLGYKLNRFLGIEKSIEGLQSGLYLVGAYTNRGKTAFLTSILLDLLFSNPEITVMYFSLDDSKRTIVNRLLASKSGIDINKVQREQADEKDQIKLRKAYDYFIGLAKKERLIIRDIEGASHINSIEAEIKERANGNLVVFIDDVYNLDTGTSYEGIREENIDRAIKIKRLVEIYDLPIICTAELRKKSAGESMEKKPNINDLMETGKFSYKADIVWFLYPEKDEAFNREPIPTLVLDYGKNKLSSFNEDLALVFTKSQGTIKEKGEYESMLG